MIFTAFIAFLPVLPGPAIVWALALIYAALTGFETVGLWVVIWLTVLMIIGSTEDWWLPAIGLRGEGQLSCGTFTVSVVGAIAGTVLIPIPVIGTLVGAAGAVALLVFYREDDWGTAWRAARGVVGAWVAGFFVEFAISLIMIYIFARALMRAGVLLSGL